MPNWKLIEKKPPEGKWAVADDMKKLLEQVIEEARKLPDAEMAKLLEQVVEEARRLPQTEQDAVAAILLEELASEQRWTGSFSKSQDQLAELAAKAIAELKA